MPRSHHKRKAAPPGAVAPDAPTEQPITIEEHLAARKPRAEVKAAALAEWINALQRSSLGSLTNDEYKKPRTVILADGTICEFR